MDNCKLSYSNLYTSSVLIVTVATIAVIAAIVFSVIMQHKSEIAADWPNQRCNPKYMPFAGFIVTPEGKTSSEYTYENFNYCIQQNTSNMMTVLTHPQVYLLNAINSAYSAVGDAINNLRGAMSSIRQNIAAFVSDVLERIMNLIAPLLKILVAMIDSFHKFEGILTSGLYTLLGAYYAIQSFIGAFFEIMIVILVFFILLIALLWISPVTWTVALSLSIPLAGFAALFAVIVAVLSKLFHLSPVKIPKTKHCFDKNTEFTMYNGETKKIYNIKPGDILSDNTRITATMKLDLNNSRMFSLQGVIVSESHLVKYNSRWIYVREHPLAIEIHGYREPYIYCINTSTKEVFINGLELLDWDDLYDNNLMHVINHIKKNYNVSQIHNYIDIHRYLDKGFLPDFEVELLGGNKYIKDVKNGDILKTGGKVCGIVEIDGNNLHKALGNSHKIYHLLTTTQHFTSNGQIFNDYNYIIDSIVSSKSNLK